MYGGAWRGGGGGGGPILLPAHAHAGTLTPPLSSAGGLGSPTHHGSAGDLSALTGRFDTVMSAAVSGRDGMGWDGMMTRTQQRAQPPTCLPACLHSGLVTQPVPQPACGQERWPCIPHGT